VSESPASNVNSIEGCQSEEDAMGERFVADEKMVEESMSELSAGFAKNAGAIADLLNRWREPNVARTVLDSLLGHDERAFRDLIGIDPGGPVPDQLPDPAGPPFPDRPVVRNFCTVIFEVAQKLVPAKYARVCRLRTDLSLREARLYIFIVRRCGLVIDEFTVAGSPGPIVPDGPCLQALIDANLVTCNWEPVANGIALQFGPPTRVCSAP
jgi:hypothetical protein